MNESVLANTLRCWKQATHSYFRTSSLRPHALTAPCRTASYTPVQHPQRRRCSRPFSSKASTIPRSLATLLTTPTSKEIEEGEVEVDLIPNDQVQLMLTDRAAEQLRTISTREHNSDAALRISVESGGCHGYQYKMALASKRVLGDYHLVHPDIKPSNLYVDAVSLPMINGSVIDFATELIGSSFRIVDNPQAKGGCGCGVSWEMKE